MKKPTLYQPYTRRRIVAEGSFWAMLLVSPLTFLKRQVRAQASVTPSKPDESAALKPIAPGFSFPAPSDVALYLQSVDGP